MKARTLSPAELEMYGIRSASEGGSLFCGVPESFSINGITYQWPRGSKLTWGLGSSRFGKLSDMDAKDCISSFVKEISECCELEFDYIAQAGNANIFVVAARLDGPSGVLADANLPMQNANPSTQLRVRFDDTEDWVISESPRSGQIDFYRTGLHEWLHACGLGHKPLSVNEEALIAPVYSTAIRNLQNADKKELIRRYGPAIPRPTQPPITPPTPVDPTGDPPGTPPPMPGAKPVWSEISQDDKRWSGWLHRRK